MDKEEYIDWLFSFMPSERNYSLLLEALYNKEFTYILAMDSNRADDGKSLRPYYDPSPCSVLEMMIALSIRMERIMEDPNYGDCTSTWLYLMIKNLGLSKMRDDKFNPDIVDRTLNRFLNRQYEFNGIGGLFSLPIDIAERERVDFRTMDIWMQANWYMSYQQEAYL